MRATFGDDGFFVGQEVAHAHRFKHACRVVVQVEHELGAGDVAVTFFAVDAGQELDAQAARDQAFEDGLAARVDRAVKQDVDVLLFGRQHRDAGELRHVAERHVPHLAGTAGSQTAHVFCAVVPDGVSLQCGEVGGLHPARALIDLFAVVENGIGGQGGEPVGVEQVGTDDEVGGAGGAFVEREIDRNAEGIKAVEQGFDEFGKRAGVGVAFGLNEDDPDRAVGADGGGHAGSFLAGRSGPVRPGEDQADTTRFLPVFLAVYIASSARLVSVVCVSPVR